MVFTLAERGGIVRYAERKKLREEKERENQKVFARHRRRWKRLAGLPAYCYLCKAKSTYGELRVVGFGRAHPHGKGNRCEPCFEKELADYASPAFEPSYPGEEIWWKMR